MLKGKVFSLNFLIEFSIFIHVYILSKKRKTENEEFYCRFIYFIYLFIFSYLINKIKLIFIYL